MMKASDVMVPHVITIGPELDVKAVANTLAANAISAVPVIDIKNNILGIISEGDLMRRIAPAVASKGSMRSHGHKAKDVMTHQVITVDPDASLQEIANLFEKHGIKRVPVVKNGELVGIVSRDRAGAGNSRVAVFRALRSGRGFAASCIVKDTKFARGRINNRHHG